MRVHLIFAFLVLVGPHWAPRVAQAEAVAPSVATSLDTTSSGEVPSAAELQAAYRNAWAHRQAGDYETAVRVSEDAIGRIEKALALDLHMATRRDLVERQSRMVGLRDAARRDLAESERAAGRDGSAGPGISEIQLQMNPDVERWIDYYTGRGRAVFERWIKRSGKYADLFRSVLQREGLPADLVQLVFVESGFNLNARSRSAAVGPWQFLRSTGRLFGLTVNRWVDERKDPEKSTVAAARYLKHLYSIFRDWPLALASYNAGEGRVLRAMQHQKTTNYWDLRLPRQTMDYVPQYMAVLAISRDPEKYGFDDFHELEREDPVQFDEVVLEGTVDLDALARMAGCTVTELRALNPAMLGNAAQGRDGITSLRVPPGKGEVLLEKLSQGAELPAVNLEVRHTVRRGETLLGIAEKYNVSPRKLAELNGIQNPSRLQAGAVLVLPGRGAARPTIATLDEGDPRASTAYVPERNVRLPATLEGRSEAEGRMTVRVNRGESLQTIAERHGATVEDIMRWNHLVSTRIRPGMVLKIRTGEAAAQWPDSSQFAAIDAEEGRPRLRDAAHEERSARIVVVRQGDTLSTIARQHGVSVDDIKRANRLRSSMIRVGQRLKLPAG